MQVFSLPERYGERIILLFVVLLGMALTCYRLAEPPWNGEQRDYMFAEYAHNARNHLRFGYGETKLGLVLDYGWLKPADGFHYRVDHPFLFPFLVSLSYLFFGVHEWSARLPNVLMSVVEVVIIYLLGRVLFGRRREALLAAFLAALFPVRCFYGLLTTPTNFAAFFGLLTLLFYQLWILRSSRVYYVAMYVSFIAGAFSDWEAYFAVPVILAHYFLWGSGRSRNWRFIVTFGLLPFLTFGLHVGWMCLLAGWPYLQDFFTIVFLNRLSSIGNVEEAFTTTEFYQVGYRRSVSFFSLPVMVMSFMWLVVFLVKVLWPLVLRLAARSGVLRTESGTIPISNYRRQETLLFALLLLPLSHNLIFRNLVFIHDYIIYNLIPFFALSAALFPALVARSVSLRVRRVVVICVMVIMICVFAFEAISSFAQLNRSVQPVLIERAKYLAGKEINRIVPKEARVMLSFKPPLMLMFYADRPWARVTDLQTFQSLLKAYQSFTHYVFDSMTPCSEELSRYLVENYPATNVYHFTIFDLRQHGSTVLAGEEDISHRVAANFADRILFLGYNVDENIQHNEREIGWWERYLNPTPELLPEYRTTFHLTYFWQCLAEVEEDYAIQVVLEGYYGKLYLVDHLHQPVNGSYPTSLWRKGAVIKEEYELEIPHGYPPLQYTLWLGVQRGDGERLRVSAPAEVKGERVKVGVISVEPVTPPPSLPDAPAPIQKGSEADVDGEILFSGYDLEPPLPSAGDKLKLTTYWRCLHPPAEDYRAFLFLRSGDYEYSRFLPLGLTRLWQPDRFYQSVTEIPLHPYLLPGTYSLELRLEKKGSFKTRLKLAEIDVPGPRRHVIAQVGAANYSDKDAPWDAPLMESAEPFSLPFTLSGGQEVEVVVGWPESLSGAKTRVDVYLKNEFWRKYLKTWIVSKDKYSFTKLRLPAHLINAGENIIELHPAPPPVRIRYSGWRAVVDWLFPDLLQDPLLHDDYEDWARPDFIQAHAVEWRDSWNDYYDLAQVYYQNKMFKEAAALWEEALSKELAAEHRIDVNLGDKVQVMAANFIPQGEGRVQIEIYFRCLEEMDQDYTLWLHAKPAETEQPHFTFDHLLPTALWERGMVYRDTYLAQLPPGRYQFTGGLWRWQNEERLWRMDEPERHEVDLGHVEVR